MEDTSIDELCDKLDESFDIEEDDNLTPVGSPSLEEGEDNSFSKEGISHATEVHVSDEAEFMFVASPKCSCNCRTSSVKDGFWPVSSNEEDGVCEYLANSTCKVCEYNTYLQSILPKPVKLPSALKGTRDKQGMEPKKLTVTWSPEVHDPSPSSFLYVKNTSQQQHTKNTKKNGKSKRKENKQKGKAASRGSNGGGGKDKKKFGKFSGKSNRGRVAFGDYDGFDDF